MWIQTMPGRDEFERTEAVEALAQSVVDGVSRLICFTQTQPLYNYTLHPLSIHPLFNSYPYRPQSYIIRWCDCTQCPCRGSSFNFYRPDLSGMCC